ncbi:MAG: AraC family transcriptional regulator [Clostridia bacterium]|nr:AraC family transcriptional regulator [Clostridia bacterium]
MKLNYIKHKIANVININKIVTIHYYELGKDFSYSGERHNFWEMVYVDSGSVEISTDEKLSVLKQGDIIFHKPDEFHTLNANKKTAANVFVISFVCSSESMHFFDGKMMSVPSNLKKHISSIIEEYKETFFPMQPNDVKLSIKDNPPIGSQQMIKTYLEQFLILLIRHEQGKKNLRVFPSKESMENHLVSEMMKWIDANIYKDISIAQICNQLNYSRAYLSKIFKQETDYTILEYIVLQKIKEAKKLIREKNMNFTQISDKLSFDNPHYFSRVFKRVTNMTPSEYKNSVH